jgi:streptogramin lyase
MTDGTILSHFPAPGVAPLGLAWDGECLWVSDRKERKIFRADPKDGHVLFSIAFDGDLGGCGWDGKFVWQADQASRTISQIDPETGEITKALKVDHASGELGGVFCQQGSLWYALTRLGQLRKVSIEDGSFQRAYPARPEVCGLVIVGKHLYYTEPPAATVHKMDVATGSVLISYQVGGQPTGIAHDGESFWVADQELKRIVRMSF